MDDIRKGNRLIQDASITSLYSIFFVNNVFKNSRVIKFLGKVAAFLAPVLALSFIFDAFLSWKRFSQAKNKTIFLLSTAFFASFIAFFACTFCLALLFTEAQAAVALMAVSTLCGLTLAVIQGVGSLIANLVRTLQAPHSSPEQKALQRRSLVSLFQLTFIFAAYKSILYFNAPLYLLAMVVATGARLAWHFIPEANKESIKSFIGLDNTQENEPPMLPTTEPTRATRDSRFEKSHYGSFFKRAYRVDVVRSYLLENHKDFALAYLKDEISLKLSQYKNSWCFEKQHQKIDALNEALLLLSASDSDSTSIDKLCEQFPLISQSFFAETSDTEDLLLAVKHYLDNKEDLSLINQSFIPQ